MLFLKASEIVPQLVNDLGVDGLAALGILLAVDEARLVKGLVLLSLKGEQARVVAADLLLEEEKVLVWDLVGDLTGQVLVLEVSQAARLLVTLILDLFGHLLDFLDEVIIIFLSTSSDRVLELLSVLHSLLEVHVTDCDLLLVEILQSLEERLPVEVVGHELLEASGLGDHLDKSHRSDVLCGGYAGLMNLEQLLLRGVVTLHRLVSEIKDALHSADILLDLVQLADLVVGLGRELASFLLDLGQVDSH